jgi:hypothetical protein
MSPTPLRGCLDRFAGVSCGVSRFCNSVRSLARHCEAKCSRNPRKHLLFSVCCVLVQRRAERLGRFNSAASYQLDHAPADAT